MQIFENLIIVGTSHVAIESVKQVKQVINEYKPKVVAIELDKDRFLALMKKKKTKQKFNWKMFKHLGIKGMLFALIGAWVEEKIGKSVGVLPGSEMKTAAIEAAKIGANVALIDQDIRITINHLFKYITWKEKLRFLWDIIKAVILRKPEVEIFDLRKVPDESVVNKLLKKTKKRYPGFYKALVKERNVYMAKNLYNLMNTYKEDKIVAFVGAGHEKDIIKIIEAKKSVHIHKKRS
ncbi:hypothetical protein D6777_04590 [Candidatus Woesearchaeota archaeon]|nr:MAG: hypothetical protein D6777_04590 [Candidatus Woesearchaeota archaeon]